MAQHGYIRDYDERSDRDEERERWSDEDRERGWRGSGSESRDSDRDWHRGRDQENSSFMFGDRGRDHQRGGDWERSPRNFRSHQDDHYLSWRERQMESLDRDYADYCREREQQFHRDFDAWRSQRGNNPGPLRTGMTQTGQSHDPSGALELIDEVSDNPEPKPDAIDAATVGTNSRPGR